MSLNGWFRPTPEQQAMIRAGWGKRPLREMAAELGVGTAALSIHARDVLGLPRLNVVPKVQSVWTEDEDAILIQGVQDGKTATQLQAMLPHRSFDAVRNRRARWAKRMQFNNVEVAEEAARRRAQFVPKDEPLPLETLQYTLDDCPRVSLSYAIKWAKQARRSWTPPKDERQAWREINAIRLYGPIPVPPFLPAARPVPDNLPDWDVGAA